MPSITDQTEEVFEALRARLRRNFAEPIHPFGLLYSGAWNWPPDRAGARWSVPPAEFILHRQPHKPQYGEMLAGPQLAVIERAAPTLRAAVRLLEQAKNAQPNRKGLLLVAADQLVLRLADQLVSKENEDQAEPARRRLKPYGVTLGGPTHYGGLVYERDLLRRAIAEVPGTEWGEIAFLRNLVSGCPDIDFFGTVIEKGEAYLAANTDLKYRKELLFTLALAYESWWSTSNATPGGDPLTYEQFAPVRDRYRPRAGEAFEKAIHLYEEVVRLAPDSVEAKAAQRQLPRLKLKLDTGQRAFVCTQC